MYNICKETDSIIANVHEPRRICKTGQNKALDCTRCLAASKHCIVIEVHFLTTRLNMLFTLKRLFVA